MGGNVVELKAYLRRMNHIPTQCQEKNGHVLDVRTHEAHMTWIKHDTEVPHASEKVPIPYICLMVDLLAVDAGPWCYARKTRLGPMQDLWELK